MITRTSLPNGGYKVEIKKTKSSGETKEQFEATKGDAKYEYGGKDQVLKFDGAVDMPICKKLGKPQLFVTDFAGQLSPKLGDLKAAAQQIHHGEKKVEVDLGTTNKWVGTPAQDGAIIFSNRGIGRCKQHVVLNEKSDGGGFIKLITKDGGSTTHIVSGSYRPDGERAFYFSESVSIRSSNKD